MKACCEFLLLIARAVEAVVRKIKTAKRQEDSAAIDADPVGWANDHFSGGVHDDEATGKAADADRDSEPLFRR